MSSPARAAADDAPHPLAPWRATLLLLALLGVGLGVLFGVQQAGRRVGTDVLDLLPRDQLDATIKLARQTVSGRLGRTLLLALADPAHPDKAPTAAAAAMGAELARSPAFAGVFTGLTGESKDRLQRWFVDRRLALRLPVWFEGMAARWRQEKGPSAPTAPDPAWLAATADADLQEFQNTSDALAYQEHLPADPLLLIPGLLTTFGNEDRATASDVAGGSLAATGPDGVHYALIQAEIKASPLTEAGQQPVFAAIDRAQQDARARFASPFVLRYTGVDKFAAETRERLQREVGLLTNISLGLSCLPALRRVPAGGGFRLPAAAHRDGDGVVAGGVFRPLRNRPPDDDHLHDGARRRRARLRRLHPEPRPSDRGRPGPRPARHPVPARGRLPDERGRLRVHDADHPAHAPADGRGGGARTDLRARAGFRVPAVGAGVAARRAGARGGAGVPRAAAVVARAVSPARGGGAAAGGRAGGGRAGALERRCALARRDVTRPARRTDLAARPVRPVEEAAHRPDLPGATSAKRSRTWKSSTPP